MALSETLKLLFNLTQFYPDQIPAFTKCLLPILKILANIRIPSPPLQPPITYLINSLLNLDLEDKKERHFTQNPLFPKFDARCNANRFITILGSAARDYTEEQLEQNAVPLVALIRKINDFAPENVKAYMSEMVLPSDDDRMRPLGKSDSLSSCLLRLSASAVAPNMREAVSMLLFELCDKDAKKFVRNVGFGFASGFLMTHNVPVPENAMEAWSTSGTSETSEESDDPKCGEKTPTMRRGGYRVNPITGQRLDMEAENEDLDMTEEEKEREAERLFVLFERYYALPPYGVFRSADCCAG